MRQRSERAERGAIIIQVAVCLLGLTAFSALVIDYGILWSARSQAQNAADAGALAGTIARAFDDTASPPTTTKVRDSIDASVQANPIWGIATPSAATEVDYNCPAGYTGRCVHVTVHRDGTNSSETIPTWFASLVGVDQQHIVATATGHVGIGNSTNCMKPWIMPDRWIEDPTTPANEFNAPGDVFTPPGFRVPTIGEIIGPLKPGNTGLEPSSGLLNRQSPNDFYEIDTGTVSYQDAIESCAFKATIGDTLQVRGNDGGLPNPVTATGVNNLIDQDPAESWDGSNKRVTGGCQPSCTGRGGNAPRVALIGLYDPNQFDANKAPTGTFGVTLINIISVWIFSIDSSGFMTGVVTSKAGGFIENGATPVEDASFLPVPRLIR